MTRIAIIDYGAGNIHSIHAALKRASASASIIVTSESAALDDATHIILPGVGAFGDCITALRRLPRMIDTLHHKVMDQTTPFLGICVGMQMLFNHGYEYGSHQGLGWIEGEVRKLSSDTNAIKIPHMGWNELRITTPQPVTEGITDGDHAYFVHSYRACCPSEYVVAEAEYGQPFPAIVAHNHIIGMQFHPEKSQATGHKLLVNFLNMG